MRCLRTQRLAGKKGGAPHPKSAGVRASLRGKADIVLSAAGRQLIATGVCAVGAFLAYLWWSWYSRPRIQVLVSTSVLLLQGELQQDIGANYVVLVDAKNSCGVGDGWRGRPRMTCCFGICMGS
jgi:hypothetical protein